MQDWWARGPSLDSGLMQFCLPFFFSFVSLFIHLSFTARQDYFTHFEPSQSQGGAKAGHPREKPPDHLQTELDLSRIWPELGSNPQLSLLLQGSTFKRQKAKEYKYYLTMCHFKKCGVCDSHNSRERFLMNFVSLYNHYFRIVYSRAPESHYIYFFGAKKTLKIKKWTTEKQMKTCIQIQHGRNL